MIVNAYKRQSILPTTNHGFENWTEVLGNERLTGTALGGPPSANDLGTQAGITMFLPMKRPDRDGDEGNSAV